MVKAPCRWSSYLQDFRGRDLYQSYCEHFASWGLSRFHRHIAQMFPVYVIEYNGMAEDTNALIDALVAEASNGSVDGEKVAQDTRLEVKSASWHQWLDTKATAALTDPVDANEPSVTPELMPNQSRLLLIGETLDSTIFPACAPADNNLSNTLRRPSGTVKLDIDGAGHMQFDNPSCLACWPVVMQQLRHLKTTRNLYMLRLSSC